MATFDGIVIGGGHNGLTCAAYLSRAGLKIAVVDRNRQIGGGCMTEELTLPGFKHNIHSNFHFFEEGPVARDLQLERYGLTYLYPEVQHGMAFRDGTAVCIHLEPRKTAASFARFSKRDAEAYLDLHEKFAVKTRDLMNQALYGRPLPPQEMMSRIKGPLGQEFLGYGRMGLYEAVDKNFEDEHIRCVFKAFLHAITLDNLPNLGSYLPRLMSRIIRLGLARGGAASLTRALGRIVEEGGGALVAGKHVDGIVVKGGRATGVRLAGGEVIEAARFVASGVDILQTVRMAGEECFGAELCQKVKNFQFAGHSLVTLHVALNEAPSYTAAKFDPDMNRAFNVVFGADRSEASCRPSSWATGRATRSSIPPWPPQGSTQPSGGPSRPTPSKTAGPRPGTGARRRSPSVC
jgi:phytoene dehydrogenase-like protein